MAEEAGPLVCCEVIGVFPIVCARTGEDIAKPGVVYIDPAQTNIDALLAAGLVRFAVDAPAGGKEDQ